jgi:hypothetical protein
MQLNVGREITCLRYWRRIKSVAPRRRPGGGEIVQRTTVQFCELR